MVLSVTMLMTSGVVLSVSAANFKTDNEGIKVDIIGHRYVTFSDNVTLADDAKKRLF